MVVQRVGGIPDLAFPREEDEDVTGSLGGEFVDGRDDSVGLLLDSGFVVPGFAGPVDIVIVGIIPERPVADLNRKGTALDGDDRSITEMGRERFGVDRRRGDDDLEVGTPVEDFPEIAEEEVDIEAAFVRLVDDDDFVVAQQFVAREFGQQDAVGHHLHAGGVGDLSGEPHLVADGVAELFVEFVGDALGHGPRGDPPRLGVADEAVDPEAQVEADLRQLGGLSRSRLTGDDDDLVVPDRLCDLVLRGGDRQILGVGDSDRMGRSSRCQPGPTFTMFGTGVPTPRILSPRPPLLLCALIPARSQLLLSRFRVRLRAPGAIRCGWARGLSLILRGLLPSSRRR